MNDESTGKQTIERQLGPGVWQGMDGSYHFNLAAILAHLGLTDTPENREGAAEAVRESILKVNPKAVILLEEENL